MDIVLWSDFIASFCAGYDDAYDKLGRKVYFDFDRDSCTQNYVDVIRSPSTTSLDIIS